jgi:hypothetical protein
VAVFCPVVQYLGARFWLFLGFPGADTVGQPAVR